MRRYFVTATGTDIGKTYISAMLLSAWRSKGYTVDATKPLMSGFSEAELGQSDAGRLLAAMGRAVTPASVADICLHRLTPALAPNVAMRQAGIHQNYDDIRNFVAQRLRSVVDFHLVEGAGGVMSPLTDDSLQIDLMADLALPVILVTAPYLGSVSHTLTAVDVLQARGIEIAAVVVSQPTGTDAKLSEFSGEIARFRSIPLFEVGHREIQNIPLLLSLQQDA